MYKVIITNSTSGQEWIGTFETQALAQAWLDEQVLKPNRNITPKWYNEDLLSNEQIGTAIDMRYVETSDNVYIKQYQLPAQATYQINDISEQIAKKEAKEAQLSNGGVLRQLSSNVLSIFTGYALAENFTTTQMNTFRTQYATILEYLKAGMPVEAKTLIDAVPVDGTVIKQTLVDSVNLEYTEFYDQYPDIFS